MDKANALGEKKISALLWSYSGPAIVGMVVNALYNVVDSIFVGQGVGEIGLVAVTLAFPMMMILMGVGMLILFRHRASLGGVNLLVLYLQDRYGWRAGKVQMLIDCLILLGALLVLEWPAIVVSVLGAVVLNLVLAFNHKAGRYSAIS